MEKFKEEVRAELFKIKIKSIDFVHNDHILRFNYLEKTNKHMNGLGPFESLFLTHALNCIFSSTGSELVKGNGSNGRKWFWLS